jgi:A/G-specific adenine glycosylase
MLQQTQVPRVLKKFPEFIAGFPSFESLAIAPFAKVLGAWQGMGYNRRAKYLQESAQIIIRQYNGVIPDNPELLVMLPGIGKATAASIITFTYNKPLIFIETNIRRVFIHHFFSDKKGIEDSRITPLVEKFLDREKPREWYYSVMDYGSYLAKIVENPNRKSKHYIKQSKFEGSNRQVRGVVLRELLNRSLSREELLSKLSFDHDTVNKVIDGLVKENFISEDSLLKIR